MQVADNIKLKLSYFELSLVVKAEVALPCNRPCDPELPDRSQIVSAQRHFAGIGCVG